MRVTLLSAIFLLFLYTASAAVPAKPPAHIKRGTLGFISGLVLGPVGLGGVFLFSHNHVQRKAAKKGCVIFATVIAATALCWLIVLAAKNGGGLGSSNHSGRSSGSGSGRGGSGGSGRSGGGSHGSGHSSSNNWGNNINWPSGGASPKKKKPAGAQLPADIQSSMFIMH
jgi:uncharacterized membrane protein YgcG